MVITIFAGSYTNSLHSKNGGAPSPFNYTGSPGDGGNTCATSCHTGTAVTPQAGWVTSNIPGTGYVAGNTYTVTATLTAAGCVKAGFEASAQSASGAKLGTIIVTNTTGTQLVSSGKYITHNSSGMFMSGGTKSWSFDWTAPASGSGTVTFYASFNASNNNNGSGGDAIFTSNLVVSEMTSSVFEKATEDINFSLFPNPAKDFFTINYEIKTSSGLQITLYTIDGREIKSILSENRGAGIFSQKILLENSLPDGIYFAMIKTENNTFVQKILIQN